MNRPSFATWRPATTYVLVGGLVVLLISLTVAYILNTFVPTTSVRIGSGVYSLQIADTEAELAQGLSGVQELPVNGGLLMKFDSDNTWSIWMKDMEIPIDIIWLDKDKQVVYIVKGATPELSTDVVFSPKTDARYVIELPAGSVEKSGIKKNQTVIFDETDTGALW